MIVSPQKLHGVSTTANGNEAKSLQETFHLSFRERVAKYFQWETLTVAGRVIDKGLVLTPTMGLTIVLALGGIFGTMWWRMSDTIHDQSKTIATQNELLIRLDQRLLDKGTSDDQRFQKLEHKFESVEAWQGVTNREIVKLQSQR